MCHTGRSERPTVMERGGLNMGITVHTFSLSWKPFIVLYSTVNMKG